MVLVAERYWLEQPLGRGAMGEVWRARDELLGRIVAVKLLLAEADETATRRFRREAEIAARLNHPHVVALYDAGAHEGRLFLAMEFVDGGSLAGQLAVHGVLPPEQVARIAAQIATGLSTAHQQGVIHRDIKPSNLLLSTDGMAKISDFGIARIVHETSAPLTMTGQILGTSSYLAPERALGRPAGPASDVYSLGCVLYELLTGRPPFLADTAAAVVHQHVDALPTRPGELRPGLPGSFEDYLLRLLAKEPGHRPTAERVADWFTAWHTDQHAPTSGPHMAQHAAAATLSSPPRARQHARRRTTLLLGTAGAVLFGSSVLLGTTLGSQADGQPGGAGPSPTPTAPTTTPTTPTTTPGEPSSPRQTGAPTTSPTTAPPPAHRTSPTPTARPTSATPSATPTESATSPEFATTPTQPAKKKGPKRKSTAR
ncbi:serine/threonine-protein kinase [Streptomyces curacoi]